MSPASRQQDVTPVGCLLLGLSVVLLASGCDHDAPSPAVSAEPAFSTTPSPRSEPWPTGVSHEAFMAVTKRIVDGTTEQAIEAIKEQSNLIRWRHPQFGTLLLAAAGHGKTEVARYLLENGTNPNIPNQMGLTPLSICMWNAGTCEPPKRGGGLIDVADVFDLLLSRGANPAITKKDARTKTITERDVITPEDSLLEVGLKLQRSEFYHAIERNALLARLRDHMDLPVDAMLPLNAKALYLNDSPIRRENDLLERGLKLQRSRNWHSIERNALLARLRAQMNLPVDAMLPLNANALYLEQVKDP